MCLCATQLAPPCCVGRKAEGVPGKADGAHKLNAAYDNGDTLVEKLEMEAKL